MFDCDWSSDVCSSDLVTVGADRLGRRATLLGLAALTAAGGVVLALASEFWVFFAAAFFGMANGMGRDRGGAVALEQAMLPETVAAERRTWALAFYNLALDTGGALGSLAAALPFVFRESRSFGTLSILDSYRTAFGLYAALMLVAAALYLGLTARVEVHTGQRPVPPVSPESKRIVYKLSALFTLAR